VTVRQAGEEKETAAKLVAGDFFGESNSADSFTSPQRT